ncbi:phosphoglucosamine mutase [Coxiella endosymbiont of Amblyomma sculptum]|uniref:phosphoglucosamine mutase n=1 Tax=Coxiella endosymbiont of Amblyomma sculptum TaxID=2487929 RepID=UPI00132F1D8A|nr:phosphoglucosamine mutase [Coxiella endosymbiont of Amblyomma sculptum]QHG92536.1 phosphoglucosamine mutase [Coxiella endosymbiont of Amblyomma sculptum]
MQKKYFGTDGIRGQVGKSLINAEFMLKLGWAIGVILADNRHSATVLIGKDTRISSYMIESALQAGLSSAGVNTKLTGLIPTPAVAYLTHFAHADAGIVISASHNSYPDNGVKFFDKYGFKFSDKLERAIEENIEKPMRTVSINRLGKSSRMYESYNQYIEFCKSNFPSRVSLKQFKIVIDCANGATYSIAPRIFHELGSDVITIGDEPNGFNINYGYGATDTQQLQISVLKHKADVGIAFDGDGDRLIMVDDCGARVDGDELLCIIAIDRFRFQKKNYPLGVVGTVMSNLGLEQTLKRHHIAFERSPVGDRYVLELIQQKGWFLGGESSGHIVDLSRTTTGDGIITALQVLRIMQKTSNSLSDLKKVMVKYPQILINVPVDNDELDVQCPILRKVVTEAEKRLRGKGRILLRPSGTEPVVRVMVEGYDEEVIKKTAETLVMSVERSVFYRSGLSCNRN